MSVPTESPVSKYGHSSELGAVLDFIQTIVRQNSQNMAKTTFIKRLICRYLLPMRRDETADTLRLSFQSCVRMLETRTEISDCLKGGLKVLEIDRGTNDLLAKYS